MTSISNKRKLNWGILGTGNIAGQFAAAMTTSKLGTLKGVASRTIDKAKTFAANNSIECTFEDYSELLSTPHIEAVYIALPNDQHATWAAKAIQKGKHVLCEKPITVNATEAEQLFKLAGSHEVTVMEGFLFRSHPQTQKLWELLSENTIGTVRHMDLSFCFNLGYGQNGSNSGNIRQSNQNAGGSIMDVGCYAVAMARLLAGATSKQQFSEPVSLNAIANLDPVQTIDLSSTALLKFDNNITATLTSAIEFDKPPTLNIYGQNGQISVPQPWKPKVSEIIMIRNGKTETITTPTAHDNLFDYQTEAFTQLVLNNQQQPGFPSMSWNDSLANMKVIDSWRNAIGLSFKCE